MISNAGTIIDSGTSSWQCEILEQIDGPAVGGTNGYGQIVANDPISLGGATLSVNLGSYQPAIGQQFILIDNTSGEPINGTFTGLPEGAMFNVGSVQFVITYQGGASKDDVILTVESPEVITLTTSPSGNSVFGEPITITASVQAANPTGSVAFYDGATYLGTAPVVQGNASYTIASLAVGSHSITAAYSGNSDSCGIPSNAITQIVTQDSVNVALNSSLNPSYFSEAVTFSVAITAASPGSGTPSGTVTFYDGATPIDTQTLSGGDATFSTSSLSVGSHQITAIYSGDANFLVNSSPAVTQIVNSNIPSVVSVVINPGEGAAGSDSYLGNSRVLSIQVVFSTPVDTAALQNAFTLTRVGLPNGVSGDNATIGVISVSTSSNGSGGTIAMLTFSRANTEGGSLADGNWTLNINAADVTNGGTPMASNYTQTNILRLFGDYFGTRVVNSSDLGVLGTTFGLGSESPAFVAAFDSDGNGQIDSTDLGRFGTNFGLSI